MTNQQQSQSIPTEKGWPLLGVFPKLFTEDPYEYLKNIMIEQGDFVQVNFGPQPVYLVSGPEYLQRILRDNYQNYRKPEFFYSGAKEISNNGLFVSTGDFWLRQKRMIQPHLHRKQLGGMFTEMVNAISDVLDDRWKLLAESGAEVDLAEQMGDITSTITINTMFGKNVLSVEEVKEISYRVSRIVKYIGETLYSTMVPKWFPIPGRRQFLEDKAATRETVNRIIANCRQEMESTSSLIEMLISAVDEESHEQMTEQQLFDEVMTIFIAGYESTAIVLTWLSTILQKHPEILQKLQAEVDEVLGERTPSFEDIPRLTYVRKVFMETLRFYSPGAFLPRALNVADQLGDYQIPANALVLIFYHGLHHNPRIWDNPEVFDPERFAPENSANRHPFAYIPFSAGPRKCLGDEFAMLEGCLALAMILQKYNFDILPNQTFNAKLGASMRPANGVKAIISFRKEA